MDYCGVAKEVVFEKGGEKLLYTCKGLENAGVALDKCTGINDGVCIETRSVRLGNDFKEGSPLNPSDQPAADQPATE